MAKLLVHENTGIREFELIDDEVRIGRELDNALRISDPSVSRHHATLAQTPQGYMIKDKQSANGVVLQGTRVSEALLMDGDQFSLGQIQITFQDPDRPRIGESVATTVPLSNLSNLENSDNAETHISSTPEPQKKTFLKNLTL